jgi:hypothetical protein
MQFSQVFKVRAGEIHAGLKTAQRRIGNIVRRDRLARLHRRRRNRMTRIRNIGAAAILASLLASPAMAQQTYRDHGIRHERNWQTSYNRSEDRNTGSWPGEAAAVGTANATAPIGGEEYARRNGFVCIPGAWFRGEDGRRHICQYRQAHRETEKAAERPPFPLQASLIFEPPDISGIQRGAFAGL